MDLKVAVLVDGSFFLKRLQFFKRKYYGPQPDLSPEQTVQILSECVKRHINNGGQDTYQHLYRVFYYDSPPIDIKAHYPLALPGETNKRVIDFSKEDKTLHRNKIFDELKKQRKFALRLGTIKHDKQWKLTDRALNDLLKGERQFSELSNDDFYYNLRQKGVDIKLGVDVATLSLGNKVDKIILIAGDSDFVPAAKLARINGLDFVLDALRNNIDPSLHEHIDGLISFDLVSIMKGILGKEPDVKPSWWNTGSNPKKAKPSGRRRRSNTQNRGQ
ncbi:NYN domain-containing protein [Shewanella sp. Isolate8]|uniref:NYN domain-containing protein n=1 Tax=Shewanella sp. Isolate8 TaxID=2908529 RepID=UPI001EFD6F9A|nr:NYN domain-containing protein [Shewanella sp. Isolate8]MCG9747787.1 NYN domain-containing protein [Shewanella sp. Isolate8]